MFVNRLCFFFCSGIFIHLQSLTKSQTMQNLSYSVQCTVYLVLSVSRLSVPKFEKKELLQQNKYEKRHSQCHSHFGLFKAKSCRQPNKAMLLFTKSNFLMQPLFSTNNNLSSYESNFLIHMKVMKEIERK